MCNALGKREVPLLASSFNKGTKYLAKDSLKTSCPFRQFQIKQTAFLHTDLAMYIIITILPGKKKRKVLNMVKLNIMNTHFNLPWFGLSITPLAC